MFFTKHFHERIMERFGIVLEPEELQEIKRKILESRENVPFHITEQFDVELQHRDISFVAVMTHGRIVTAHRGKPMPRKKFFKLWNSGRIKKN